MVFGCFYALYRREFVQWFPYFCNKVQVNGMIFSVRVSTLSLTVTGYFISLVLLAGDVHVGCIVFRPKSAGRQVRTPTKKRGLPLWVPSLKSVVSACPRRSTVSCFAALVFSVVNSASKPNIYAHSLANGKGWVFFIPYLGVIEKIFTRGCHCEA
ncbi:Uncharacterised protein [Corynebacterium kutscheri]|uniref:Uncharacterized protein n=1 Tax=Corynebacterium kutscheri TaxID=35755 RepID=A0AB38VRI3_9CORY|nr:Uncharacterised protein [Corynebacterium kutscheri]